MAPKKFPGQMGLCEDRALLTHISFAFLAGVFSMYFHMTLSYVGQLLDELSILWTLAVAYSFWYPRVYFPRFIKSRYDSEGHRVAGSEGRAGTSTRMCVTHRSPPSSQPAPLQGASVEVTAVCFGTRPSITQWWAC